MQASVAAHSPVHRLTLLIVVAALCWPLWSRPDTAALIGHALVLSAIGRLAVNSRREPWLFTVCGAVLGILAGRPNASHYFVPAALGLMLFSSHGAKRTAGRRSGLLLGALALGFLAVIAVRQLATQLWLSNSGEPQFLQALSGFAEPPPRGLSEWILAGVLLAYVVLQMLVVARRRNAQSVASTGYVAAALVAFLVDSSANALTSAWTVLACYALFIAACNALPSEPKTGRIAVGLRRGVAAFHVSSMLWIAGALVIAGAVVLRISNLAWGEVTFSDATQYLRFAEDLRSGAVLSPGYDLDAGFVISRRLPPLYPALIAAFSFLPLSLPKIGNAVSVTMSLLTLVPVFLLARRARSALAGTVAVSLAAFHPFLLQFAAPILTEATFTFFFVAACCATSIAIERRCAPLFLLSGTLCGLAYLTREIGLLCLGCAALSTLIYYAAVERVGWKRAFACQTLLWLAFAVVAAPYWLYIKQNTGRFSLSARQSLGGIGEGFWRYSDEGRRRDLPPTLRERPQPGATGDSNGELAENPLGRFGRKVAGNAVDYAMAFARVVDSLPLILASSALIFPIVIRAKDRQKTFLRSLYVFAWGTALIVAYAAITSYMVDVRYVYPVTPLLAVLCGIGIADWAQTAAPQSHRDSARSNADRNSETDSRLPFVAALVAVALLYFHLSPRLNEVQLLLSEAGRSYSDYAGHAEMGRTLLARHPDYAGLRVVSRKLFGPYHLRASDNVAFPFTDEGLGRLDADLLVADSLILRRYRPQLVDLALGMHQPPPGKVIYSRLFPEYHRIITVYDLREKPLAEPPPAESLEQRLTLSWQALGANDIHVALLQCRAILREQPDHAGATRLMAEIRATLNSTLAGVSFP